jgi:dolichyl-phosphate beta-glucosyltransferase
MHAAVPVWLEIVIPARNEAYRLPRGLALLCEKAAGLPPGVSILVVDSASSDDTPGIVSRWPDGPVPVRLIRCPRPGKGAAVRAGLLATRAPLVGFCDADMATDLSALDVAIELLASGHRLVIGSRAHADSQVEARHSVLRGVGAAAFRALTRAVAPGVRDSQCGFKFFAGPVARAAALDMTTTGFAFDVELIAHCQRLGAEPTEIPVRWRDIPGSKFSVTRHSLAAFWDVVSIWLAQRRWTRGTGPARASALMPGPMPIPVPTTMPFPVPMPVPMVGFAPVLIPAAVVARSATVAVAAPSEAVAPP